MSFGFGVSDFIAVLQLANQVRARFVDAPEQFKAISTDVKVLSNALRDVDDALPQRDLTIQQYKDLDEIAKGCFNVLKELEIVLDRNQELNTTPTGVSGKSRRIWKRLQWDQKDIEQFRSRISLNINAFNTFQGGLTINISFATKYSVDRLHQRQDDRERREKHHDILDWLSPIDCAAQHSDFTTRQQEGTGHWLLDAEPFRTWVNQRNQTLFCPGIPGAGKTMSAAIVIDNLYTEFYPVNVGIAYVYCNFRRHHEQNPIDLLASLAKQLIQALSSAPQSIQRLYEQHHPKRTRPSLNEISQVLQSAVLHYSKAFIVIYALDECQSSGGARNQLLAELFNLQAKTSVNLFATSRFIPEIEKEFAGRSMQLKIRANDEDLQRYIDRRILYLPSFVSRSTVLQNEIKTAIINAVDGVFLLAKLHLDSLIGKPSVKAIRLALRRLPKGPKAHDQAYQDAMERIEEQVADAQALAKKVLSWITCAKRPLTTLELQHALAVEVGESELDEENLPGVENMVSVCTGLVTVNNESHIIQLVHHTTQEYFEQTKTTWFPNVQRCIVRTCITYLLFDTFEAGFCETDEKFEQRLYQNPFYDYAPRYWGDHASVSPTEEGQLMLDLLQNEAKVSSCSQVMVASRMVYCYNRTVPMHITGVHVAAYFGLRQAMAALSKIGHDLSPKDSNARTPLSWAAENGHEAVVGLLLEADAEPESQDIYYRTPLMWAAEKGHDKVVRLLLDGGAKLERKDIASRTPLWWAAENGHELVVKLLLERGADLESKDVNNRTPLMWAAEKGHNIVVRLLLDGGAKPEHKDITGRTPLSWAAEKGHDVVVRLLLGKGTDLESEDIAGQTPLWWAAQKGHDAVVRLLLDNGADPESKDIDNQTPLWWAAEKGHDVVVRLLLEKGAYPESRNGTYGQTPLWWAARNGHEAVVRLLVENGADPESKDKTSGRTPQWWAAENGHEAVVRLLRPHHGVLP